MQPVQELSGTSVTANMLSGLGVDEYFTRTDAAGIHTLLTDGLGSTLALTDNAGTVKSDYTYEPYGRTATIGPVHTNPFQYTGRENDGTGLYYYRARYYLPSIQRFISDDPLGFMGGDLNLYAYVGGNPINYIDPIGTTRKDAPPKAIVSPALHETVVVNPDLHVIVNPELGPVQVPPDHSENKRRVLLNVLLGKQRAIHTPNLYRDRDSEGFRVIRKTAVVGHRG
jgi:RHS repeat-associated protein